MKNHFKANVLLLFCFLCIGLFGFTQSAEQTRAANFLQLQQLLALQTQSPYYLTAANINQIAVLKKALVCQNTATVCKLTGVLPVTGLVLTGQRTNNEKVQLQWQTTAEYNNKGFVLERQSLTNTTLYDSLTFVNGAGTSYTKSNYAYTDLNSYKGNSFYRLKQEDFDGNFVYSNTIMVEGYGGKFDVSVAPNPSFNSNVRIYFKGLDNNQTVNLTIFNAIGRQLFKKDNFLPVNGYFEMANQSLSQGYYFVTVSSNGETYTKQFTIVR